MIMIVIWIVIAYLITIEMEFEIFFILLVIGILIIKEYASKFTVMNFQNKLHFLIFVLIIIFFILMAKNLKSF